MNNDKEIRIYVIILLILLYLGIKDIRSKPDTDKKKQNTTYYSYNSSKKSSYSSNTYKQESKDTVNEKDPLSLSMKSVGYFGEKEIFRMLARSKLEYASKIEYLDGYKRYVWILKSNNKEVYSCDFSFSRTRKRDERTIVACQIEEAYEDWVNGDKLLYRTYPMPVVGDDIEIDANAAELYYENYYFLGKFSDMYCYTKGNDIYCTYYWYQNTDRGPMMVYTVKTKNYVIIDGYRYNSWLWETFEETKDNVDIIPYDEYPRKYDYMEIYNKWEAEERERRRQQEIEEIRETYCITDDPEDFYEEFFDEFEDYDEAEMFFDDYCE